MTVTDIKPIDVGPQGFRPEGASPPTITSLTPANAIVGDPADIVMVVEGENFNRSTVIIMNGFEEPTTLIDPTHVSTGVKPSLFVVPASVPVMVRNDGYPVSNEVAFEFVETAAPEAAAHSKRKR
jgi:hypothetical protein